MFTLTIGVETLVYEQILYKIRNLRKLCYMHVLYIILLSIIKIDI